MIRRELGELRVFDTPELLAQGVADAFLQDANDAIRERGAFFVALAGGSTPKAAYTLLAQEPRRGGLDWNHVFVYFGDERCVGPDDVDSNYRMAREAFLHSVGIPDKNVHRMRGEDEPAQAARDYAAMLIETMGDNPRFDLIMLGMGPDGHTASLFPGTDPLTDDDRLVRAVFVQKLGVHRITLTPHVINNARHVLISTEGLPKAPALYAVREGPYDPQIHPVQIVSPHEGRLTWCIDKAASAELP